MNVSRQAILEYGKPLRELAVATPDEVWKRIELLRADDRLILELGMRGGTSHRRIGQLLGRTAGSVSRHLARLSRRLHDPVVLTLLHPACPLEGEFRQIGVERLLVGMSVAELAEKHELSTARVRRIVELVRLWHRGLGGRRGASTFSMGRVEKADEVMDVAR
ncbi:MAG: hypothetical protein ABIP55_08980 [Tepidisphaeraceae bacterium]